MAAAEEPVAVWAHDRGLHTRLCPCSLANASQWRPRCGTLRNGFISSVSINTFSPFAENDINFAILPHLTDQDFRRPLVVDAGHERAVGRLDVEAFGDVV